MDKKYLIICLRHDYWDRFDHLVFWGKNSNGYSLDLANAGLYTKEEALKKCDTGDIYISIDKLGITEDMFNVNNPAISIRINKTDEVVDYVNNFVQLMRNKKLMERGA
jgi:hypothetical protein